MWLLSVEVLRRALPGQYLIESRLKSSFEKMSWIIIYAVPPYIVGWYFYSGSLYVYSILFFLATLAFNSIYELGYLENDIKTVLTEEQPTMRLSIDSHKYYRDNYTTIVVLKILMAGCLVLAAKMVAGYGSVDIYVDCFFLVLIFVRITFYFHNTIRSKGNIFTFCLLSTVKYAAPLSLIVAAGDLAKSWLMIFFLFPVIRTMEHATKYKYGLTGLASFVGDHDLFRVKYYGSLALFFLVVYVVTQSPLVRVVFILLSYFMCFRIGAYLLVKKTHYRRNVSN